MYLIACTHAAGLEPEPLSMSKVAMPALRGAPPPVGMLVLFHDARVYLDKVRLLGKLLMWTANVSKDVRGMQRIWGTIMVSHHIRWRLQRFLSGISVTDGRGRHPVLRIMDGCEVAQEKSSINIGVTYQKNRWSLKQRWVRYRHHVGSTHHHCGLDGGSLECWRGALYICCC